MNGQVNIADSLQLIAHRTQSRRNEGFQNLKNILRKNRKSNTLTDKNVHYICDALFHVAIEDRAAYLKAATKTTRTAAENRLTACAQALRSAVEDTVHFVRLRTLRALIDHITSLLVGSDGLLCEPLALDYAKSLTALFSYQAHAEHLRPKELEDCIFFCVQVIGNANSSLTDDDSGPGAERGSTPGPGFGTSYRSSRSLYQESADSQGARSLVKQVSEELVGCLALLTSAPNADMGSQSSVVLDTVIGFLRTGAANSKPQQDAFAVINNLLLRITTQDVALTQRNLGQLVRLLRIYWSPKLSDALNALRDRMLISFIHLLPYISSAIQKHEDPSLRSELSAALNSIRSEYSSRPQRSQLQMEDIILNVSEDLKSTAAIEMPVCGLRCAGFRGEANWATVHTMASLCSLLSPEDPHSEMSDAEHDDIDARPRKRQRTMSELDETLHASVRGRPSARVTALQTLTFLAQQMTYSFRQMTYILDKLSLSCADDDVDISSWALLALASFSMQDTAKHPALSNRWLSTWQLATRAMSNAGTCRSACHLLCLIMRIRLVPMQTLTDFVHNMSVSMDLNGPTVLADSVARLFTHVVRFAQQTNPAASAGTAESVLGWTFRAFTPSRFADREYAAQQVLFEASDVIELITGCLGKNLASPHGKASQYPQWGSVGQAWLQSSSQSALVGYLLLSSPRERSCHSSEDASPAVFDQNRPGCETITLSNLISESHRTQENWSQMALRNMSRDMFTLFCKACHITSSIAFCCGLRDERRQAQLQRQTQGLLQSLVDFAKTSICSQDHADAMLVTFSCAFRSLQAPNTSSLQCDCEHELCRCVAEIMEERNEMAEDHGHAGYDDLMELDDEFDTQDSRRAERASETQELPNDNAVAFGTLALRADMNIYAMLRTRLRHGQEQVEPTSSASRQTLDAVLSMPRAMVFAGRTVISRLSELGIEVTADDAATLAEFLAESLEVYQFERSEVALGAILDIMASIISAWTDQSNENLYKDGLDIYDWYISTGFPNHALSPNVQCRLASLLLQLCHIDFDYGQNDSCPSARTSIFELIRKGNIAVQYHLAGRISSVFGLFVLSNHPIIFGELRNVLPENSGYAEGMAIRLLFFSKIASAWHSLLRECVYYIVETAEQSTSAAKYAARCVSNLADALHFDSPQKLFRLFAPQLLHSWLETQTVSSLPFAVFNYDSLDALISSNASEITAQLVVRGQDEGLDVVVSALSTTKTELLRRCFAKCEAYCISHDISKSAAETETRLRAGVGGKEHVQKLTGAHYPAIIAQFFLSAQNEDVEDRWLEKKGTYNEEAKALKEMRSYSCSNRELPVCQQPSYKSKWLCDQIERLCRRVAERVDPSQRWDASVFTFAARSLLDSIDGALGPLHTCLVIRRLRILISLAGKVAVTEYQLEMLITALRPYLNDSQCADDTMGILQYLFRHGQAYLKTQPPFLCGTVTLMTLQIRKHSVARQESTTQQSQHKATVDKMLGFHAWLVDYLKSCQPRGVAESSNIVALAQSLSQVQLPGNARGGSPESALLLMLLGNGQDHDKIFRIADREEALVILSENFELPPSVEDDCLGEDVDCVPLVQQLWQACQLPGLGNSFIGWVAGALGRAYAASGIRPVHQDLSDNLLQNSSHEGAARSQAAIARRLVDALYGGSRNEASMAYTTLRSALSSFGDAHEAIVFENMLPQPLVPALQPCDLGQEPVLSPVFRKDEWTSVGTLREPSSHMSLDDWIQRYSIGLCQSATKTPILPALTAALQTYRSWALDMFPMIVHILLETELERDHALRTELSACVAAHFSSHDSDQIPKQAYLLKLLLYLRAQILPGEHTEADRLRWLEVDWLQAAEAATRCKMPETALLFAESATTPSGGNRRASSRTSMSQVTMNQVSQDLLLSIFREVDEPDSFYGVEQTASLDSVLGRFDYEADGFRSLMFRSAQMDTHLLKEHKLSASDSAGMVRSLSMLNLSSLTFTLLSSGGAQAPGSSNELLNSARKLQQWDIAAPEASSGAATSCFTVFQELSRVNDRTSIREKLQSVMLEHLKQSEVAAIPNHAWFGALASIVEVEEVVGISSSSGMRARWKRMQSRQDWMNLERFDDVSSLVSNRQILFSTLARNEGLLKDLRASVRDTRGIEVEALLNVASFAREHNQLQEALSSVSHAGDLVPVVEESGLNVGAAVKLSTASVLWDLNEATAAVKMMKDTLDIRAVDQQNIEGPGKAGLLARLAHQLAEARLEKPDSILSQYLEPAIQQLRGVSDGEEAGEVFHEFATFCDKQLQNPGSIEDFERIARLRQKKLEEVQELERLFKSSRRRDQQDSYYADAKKARKWFEIDDADYQRLKSSRDTFMQQSLQNYMLTLRATNKYNIAVLRLFALWLENADVPDANNIASKHLSGIPSWKFVLLMNQLMSRLESDGSKFQKALSSLLLRICSDHPHHSLHHLFATTRKPANGEQAAASRQKAAMTIRAQISGNAEKGKLLERIFQADKMYDKLANEDGKNLSSRASIKDLYSTEEMRQKIPNMGVPPITINVQLRPNGDYSDVPVVTRFGSTVRVMSGLSRPKSISVYASDGQQYSQLFKSGNDDLRQDAIMEQVFEEVSKMLRNHKATRQRNLVVRTYKVIPLGPNSGAIEFVPNSISFSEFLKPAHERYYPQDYKDSKARGMIQGVKDHSTDVRIKEFRKVCEHMHPVMRHFFFERFNDPDEWFQKRTAYTRTTATISILGYVLGLGDRHCQNIMLDEKTGEVVHIDLGVAFEAGRVLPIPELVPFRLSRDVVDGMGITKTEGVFRRCCEFTMDALREDKDSIMTLLNVLRYDPLYTWNVSPLRAKRMQEETGREDGAGGVSKKKEAEAGEAERALSIVEKKLSKTLSTAATVNELIQQATDERNLATLFSGWSAWF